LLETKEWTLPDKHVLGIDVVGSPHSVPLEQAEYRVERGDYCHNYSSGCRYMLGTSKHETDTSSNEGHCWSSVLLIVVGAILAGSPALLFNGILNARGAGARQGAGRLDVCAIVAWLSRTALIWAAVSSAAPSILAHCESGSASLAFRALAPYHGDADTAQRLSDSAQAAAPFTNTLGSPKDISI
jgi:hypothetical protein